MYPISNETQHDHHPKQQVGNQPQILSCVSNVQVLFFGVTLLPSLHNHEDHQQYADSY
jgi:hypothetical protein